MLYADEIIEALKQVALNDKDAENRAEACTALGLTKDPQVLNTLAQVLENDPEYLVRYDAIRAVSKLDTHDIVPVLLNALKDPEPDIRTEALATLQRYIAKNA